MTEGIFILILAAALFHFTGWAFHRLDLFSLSSPDGAIFDFQQGSPSFFVRIGQSWWGIRNDVANALIDSPFVNNLGLFGAGALLLRGLDAFGSKSKAE